MCALMGSGHGCHATLVTGRKQSGEARDLNSTKDTTVPKWYDEEASEEDWQWETPDLSEGGDLDFLDGLLALLPYVR